MTKREQDFMNIGYHYAAEIESALAVTLPSGREVRKVNGKWEVQPPHDNYWVTFDDLLQAIRFGMGMKVS
jgi:hypothetical protein